MMTPSPGDQASLSIYNLPMNLVEPRGEVYAEIVRLYNQDAAKLTILEIGVYKASLLKGFRRKIPEMIAAYYGVDPYLGDTTDPYFASYWRGERSVAEEAYTSSKAYFEDAGGTLLRMTSDQFFAQNSTIFDVIIVDGDHRVEPAIRDLKNSLRFLAPGGLLMCDDYGNSDTPQVTKAVNTFLDEHPDFFSAAGFRPIWFQNKGKHIPIQLSVVYWKKK